MTLNMDAKKILLALVLGCAGLAQPAIAAEADGTQKIQAPDPEAGDTPVATPAPKHASAKRLTARSRLDARECLDKESNEAIIRCAERFR